MPELREIGYRAGLSRDELVEGDATELRYNDNAFDLVTEFGVLHYVKHPHLVVAEMLRVAKRAILISDTNNFGQGKPIVRAMKQLLNSLSLWQAADFIKTGGKGYRISEGDGLSYSYSVFNNHKQIDRQCKSVHILNTSAAKINPYKSASHIALLGIKE